MRKRQTGLSYAKCAWCGKKFVPAPYHAYKISDRYYCTWTCISAYRKEREAYKELNYTGRADKKRYIAMAKLRKSGLTYADIAKRYGLSYSVTLRLVKKGLELMEKEQQGDDEQ